MAMQGGEKCTFTSSLKRKTAESETLAQLTVPPSYFSAPQFLVSELDLFLAQGIVVMWVGHSNSQYCSA